MNKKFSTFFVGAALLGAVSAYAGNPVTSLKKTGNNLYQLEVTVDGAKKILSMESNGALKVLPSANLASESLASTLWCIEVTDEAQGKNPTYDFTNKATGQRLDINYAGTSLEGLAGSTPVFTDDSKDSTFVGGEIAGWAYSLQYTSALKPSKLYSYFKADSVIGLAVEAANNKDRIQVVKLSANEAPTAASLATFTLVNADVIRLDAATINTMFGQQAANKGVGLTFSVDEMGTKLPVPNPFNGKNKKFFAEAINGDNDYVYVYNTDSAYLRVDTTLTNEVGTASFRAFKLSDLTYKKLQESKASTVPTSPADSISKVAEIADQYKFAFSYYPSSDSVVIQVKQALEYVADASTNSRKAGSHWATGSTTILPTTSVDGENNFVTVQDLVKGKERIITIDDKLETRISFNYTGCKPVESNKTSIGNGLYIIKNEKGQVLASPIHKDGASYEWITLDAQDPLHMPAYQWLIWKTQDSDLLKATSPIKVTNREFNGSETIQLYKDENGKITMNTSLFSQNVKNLTFEQVTDSTIIKDKVLGYKYVKTEDLQVAKFKFNYLHSFNHDKWIGLTGSADSVLYVQDNNSAFTLINAKDHDLVEYGVKVDANVLKKIPGLAQLHRTLYKVAMNGKYLVTAAEDKYAVGAVNEDKVTVDYFYFKENNHYDGKHYYAIVKADFAANDIDGQKVGIADDGITNSLKVQDLAETRTSAFTVEPLNVPLYRRFDSEKLEGNAGDASDTLRFVETYRGEVLQIEGNPSFKVPGVDMLGIYTADKAPSGLSFVVDTAWVTRGLGYIKPQYLISIDRHDFDGVKGKECTETGKHIDRVTGEVTDDASMCIHATPAIPGFERGQYLVNFADSAAAYANENQNIYKWKGYDRVGFVEAIRLADTLYILRNEFKGLPNDKINFAAIKAADKAATDKGGKTYIHRLDNDKHKYVTWSMRFTDPGKAANEVETDRTFLVESMKNTGDKDIAPEYASWLKNQNGCLVMSNYDSNFNELQTGGDDALVFNVKHVADDPIATDNEAISTSAIKVVGENGFVTISGAQGKNVVISTVLGQTIANTVISSDKVNFNAPAGVVVVAVEGEEAVKAIVK